MNQGVSASQSVGFINDGGNGCVCCGFGISSAVAAAETNGGVGASGPHFLRVHDRQPQAPIRQDSVPMAMAARRRP